MGPYSQSWTHFGPIFVKSWILFTKCLDKKLGKSTQIWKVKIRIGISKVDSWIPDEKLVWHEVSRNYGIIWKWDWFIQTSDNWATALCFRRHVFCWNTTHVFCLNRRYVYMSSLQTEDKSWLPSRQYLVFSEKESFWGKN